MTTATDMVAVEGVRRTFGSGRTAAYALRGVSFTVPAGQLVALRGRSGSGKTTLLNIVGGLDMPDDGVVRVGDSEVTAMSEHERMRLRRTSVAFIFQSFGLIPILSAAENVGVPLRIAGMAPKQREERVRLMLDIVGLGEHTRQRPGELSGGQQQRVAIARALAGSPQVLLADEPTGQLDSETAKQIMRLLHTVVESEGVTALVATHDPNLIGIADSVLELEDGKIKGSLSGGSRGRPHGRWSPVREHAVERSGPGAAPSFAMPTPHQSHQPHACAVTGTRDRIDVPSGRL